MFNIFVAFIRLEVASSKHRNMGSPQVDGVAQLFSQLIILKFVIHYAQYCNWPRYCIACKYCCGNSRTTHLLYIIYLPFEYNPCPVPQNYNLISLLSFAGFYRVNIFRNYVLVPQNFTRSVAVIQHMAQVHYDSKGSMHLEDF